MSEANVITPNKILPRGNPSAFPAWHWLADGTAYLAKTIEDVVAGSTPYHPDSAPAAAPKASGPTLTKAETIAQLQAGGIEHVPTSSHKSLYELLLTGVKNALAEAKIEYDVASNDAKALLELFPKG